MSFKDRKEISLVTLRRRDVLEWLGGATVLALGGPLLNACASYSDSTAEGAADSLSPGDTTGPTAPQILTPGDYSFPFQPGGIDASVFSTWGERTVDPQDLTRILANWQLTVDGMVENPRVFSFAELLELPRTDQVTDFHCVEGWSVYDVPWNGVQISRLLEEVTPSAEATYVTFHTIDGKYNESLPIDIALEPKTLLAYGINGNTIPFKHGFPLRVVIPRLLGYKNAKYIDRIELTDRPVDGYWVAYGYPYDGEVSESRLRDGKY